MRLKLDNIATGVCSKQTLPTFAGSFEADQAYTAAFEGKETAKILSAASTGDVCSLKHEMDNVKFNCFRQQFTVNCHRDVAIKWTGVDVALFYAATSGHVTCTELIIQYLMEWARQLIPLHVLDDECEEAPDMWGNPSGHFPTLCCAIEGKHEAVVGSLLRWGVSPNHCDTSRGSRTAYGCTIELGWPIVIAVQASSVGIVELLAERGAVTASSILALFAGRGCKTCSPTLGSHIDCAVGPAVVHALTELGAQVNHQTSNGNTALHLAALFDWHGLIGVLESCGASTSIVNNAGLTPLELAANHNRTQSVKALVRHGGPSSQNPLARRLRALLIPQANPGSRYRCGKDT